MYDDDENGQACAWSLGGGLEVRLSGVIAIYQGRKRCALDDIPTLIK